LIRPRRILVTRPEPGLAETVHALATRGFDPVPAPLLTVHPLRPAIPVRVQAILLTSGQAAAPLAALAPALRHHALLAVGDATAARARACGFDTVTSAAGDAARLAVIAAERLDPRNGPLLLACGLGQGADLATDLRLRGFRVIRRCVYAARPVPRLPDAALHALRSATIDAALFFSAETAAIFVRVLPPCLHNVLSEIGAFAVSPRAAAPLRALRWRGIEAAAFPTAASLLALLDGS
jgi:uroporphyrinogen-III synthase